MRARKSPFPLSLSLSVTVAVAVTVALAAALVLALVPVGGPAVAAASPMSPASPPSLPPRGELQSRLTHLVESEAATAALLRVQDGQDGQDGQHRPAHWSGRAGVRDLASGTPAAAHGHFRIGSVTKTFVATVVLQLVDEGRLALDDPIDRHLPGVVPGGDRITVRQILNHTSGIYDYAHERDYSTNRWRGEARFRTYHPEELLAVAFAHEPYFPPGGGWHYSNTNYLLAGLLVERLTGRPYGAEIQRRILRPLGMVHTSVPGNDPRVPEPHARGYARVDGQDVDATEMNPSLDWAAGEMISTTADLDRFLAALLGGRLTSPASLAAMRETVATGTLFRYGLGLQQVDLPCGRTLFGHGGELLGFLTYAMGDAHGRQATLSYNPYHRKASAEDLMGIFSTAFCPPGGQRS
ncbi:serine hydrolase domain-containing protein [Streptoalloteichus tenebrarius]|uniref:serine hydrolase domain-containing protein n=1 Tax=Streptoalloteichus tenebrarius (strain ATCC 17920 / DSM 40477 / JCM 4838 / CBS 697.72 / NBRC 16177 / NCIMB 11028 / NRRL B-12390 / A12253. 1 / ISP 5477) TaxID=1933 RepID=UPI0020A37656|nr:serine hydrolase domain-containing protein [Streptoalloteichus tenebrarius]BFF04094.1 serine hydrolase domain-containing protein [Streptoalloteichus tenebrarius]